MTSSIPVSQIVTINPSVVGTGGNPLALNGVFLTDNAIVPVGTLLSFASADDVGEYFGTSSTEYDLATIYFGGFTIATQLPSTIFFAPYVKTARAAWLRGTSLSGKTLATIKAITGSLTVTIDSVAHTYATIDLSTATSFTNAAALLTTGLGLTGAAVTWDSTFSKFVITSGTTGVESTMTQCTGTAASSLGLSAGTLSQGSDVDTEVTAMNRVKAGTANWATFTTTFEPDLTSKTAFADWSNDQNKRYLYLAWDSDTGYLTANNDAVFGAVAAKAEYNGTCVVYNTAQIAAFIMSCAACIDWDAENGRITFAFKSQSGLSTTVDTLADATAVLSNGASYYGFYGAPGEDNEYSFFYNGNVPGEYKWIDPYINQIFLNAQLQLAVVEGLLSVNSSPYNDLGKTFITAWCADPIQQALKNGTIRKGVSLSTAQKAQINAAAGLDISNELQTQGYYLQALVSETTAQTRGNRESPTINFWYMDGGSVQQITIASIAVL